MKETWFLILIFIITAKYPTPLFSQVNCCTKIINDTSITTCLHVNNMVSTVEWWSSDGHCGNFKAYDNKGKELLSYGLHRFGFYASVFVSYYPNGQVRKVEYSSHPDGGIQFFKIIHIFDDIGKQVGYQDLSQPNGIPILYMPSIQNN